MMRSTRRWVVALGILAVLAAFVVWLEPTRALWGRLRGEAFYQGRPASYWNSELEEWEFFTIREIPTWIRRPNLIDRARDWWQVDFSIVTGYPPQILSGDPAATNVLLALERDGSIRVRHYARLGLKAVTDRKP